MARRASRFGKGTASSRAIELLQGPGFSP